MSEPTYTNTEYAKALADAADVMERASMLHLADPKGSPRMEFAYAEASRVLRAWSVDPSRMSGHLRALRSNGSQHEEQTRSNPARKIGLTALELHLLDAACIPVRRAFGNGTYLVGTAQTGGPFRDVDVRVILPDEKFDLLFADNRDLWSLVCSSVGWRLGLLTCLPVDFQIQRQTEANAKYDGPRNPIGTGRPYAAEGDATRFTDIPDEATR